MSGKNFFSSQFQSCGAHTQLIPILIFQWFTLGLYLSFKPKSVPINRKMTSLASISFRLFFDETFKEYVNLY